MAYIQSTSQSTPTTIDNFLGLNMNETGDTQIKLGESGKMKNFRITKDYKLSKICGYEKIYDRAGLIRAQWKGKIGDTDAYVYVRGTAVYNFDARIGTLTDAVVSIFEFNRKLYFINGNEYKSWDGTTFVDIAGYVPLIKIATTPAGVGTDYEAINVLTGKKHQTFSATGDDTEFYIVEKNIDSIDRVLVNGVATSVTTDLVNGKVTFATAPAQGVDNVDIYWTKGTGQRDLICKNRFAMTYGLADDTRVFLYGNENAKNRIYFSALANGVPSVEYFPGTNFIDVGSSNTAVTDISRQYDRLIISKEDETYYAGYEAITDSTGSTIITFPVYPLNSSHGMVAYGQGQLLDNYVTTIDTSIIQWVNTESKDERNAQIISQRIQEWLNSKDLSKAVTCDYQELKEYWIAVDREIMIYNYGNSTFYLLEVHENVTSLLSADGTVYLGTDTGKIFKFSEEETTFDGEIIEAEWHSGYYDFGVEYKRKTMRVLWLALKPQIKTSVDINYVSDRDSSSEEKTIRNRTISYRYWNYADFTYNTESSVKPFRVKLKAKKFAFLKIILSNKKSDEKLIINSIAIKKSYGGEVK